MFTKQPLRSIIFRGSIFVVLWLILTGANLASLIFGAPAILLAVWASLKLIPSEQISVLALAKFIPLFIWQSVRSAVDVGKRAILPLDALDPALVEYEISLQNPVARVMLINIINLLPGTLVVEQNTTQLKIHLLDQRIPYKAELQNLEARVADIFKQHEVINTPPTSTEQII